MTKDACGFDGNLAIYENCRRISELEDFTKKNDWKYLKSGGTIIAFISALSNVRKIALTTTIGSVLGQTRS